MITRTIRVYLVAEDGSDRIYVSTKPPSYVKNDKNSHVFAVDVELPEEVTLDSSVVRVLAKEIEDPPAPLLEGMDIDLCTFGRCTNKAVSVFRDKYRTEGNLYPRCSEHPWGFSPKTAIPEPERWHKMSLEDCKFYLAHLR